MRLGKRRRRADIHIARRPTQRRRRRGSNRRKGIATRLPDASAVRARLGSALRRAAPVLIAVAAAAAISGGGYVGFRWLTSSDRFAVAEVQIRGQQRIDRERVLELGGIALGTNIFQLDLDQVERSLERDPWIASATVKRHLPGRLVIEIEENRAAAVVELGGLYLADARGAVFKRASIAAGETEGLPLVTGIVRSHYLEHSAEARALIRRGIAIFHRYHQRSGRPPLGEIHMDEHQGITLVTLDHAVAVRFGHASDAQLGQRLEAFDAAWSSLAPAERANARVIHVDDASAQKSITVAFATRPDAPSAN